MRFFILFTLLASFSFPAWATCDPGEQVIRVGTPNDLAGSVRKLAVTEISNRLNAALQGKACAQVVFDDNAYSDDKTITATKAGEVELTLPGLSALGKVVPSFRAYELPFAFRDYASVARFAAQLNAPSRLDEAGIASFGLIYGPFDQIAAKRPIYEPLDIRGAKVRLSSGTYTPPMIRELTALPRTVAENDIQIALNDGRIDVQFLNWSQLLTDRTAKIFGGITQSNHRFSGFQVIASKSWWEGLDTPLRKAISKAVLTAIQNANTATIAKQAGARGMILRTGVAVRLLTRQQRARWISLLRDIWDEFPDRGVMQLLQRADARP